MKLLVETLPQENEIQIVQESTDNGEKKYFIEGIFAQAEKKNRNGRIYPRNVLENAIREYSAMVAEKRAIGELNHPAHPTPNPERASHLVTLLEWRGNDVYGKAKVLTSLPMGKIVKGLIDEGVKFGVSTRGLGSLVESGDTKIVQDDFRLSAIDCVSDPSGIDCWVEGILESKEWILDAATGQWVAVEQAKTSIRKLTSSQLTIERKLELFEQFLRSIHV